MSGVIWSESLPFPEICEYHRSGCQCSSPQGLTSVEEITGGSEPSECDYCEWGCQCGAEDWEEPGDGGYEEEPECECECECCQCPSECECEILIIDADSFNDWVRDVCYIGNQECLDSIQIKNKDSVHCKEPLGGGYEFRVRIMPTKQKIRLAGFMGMPSDVVTTMRTSLAIYDGIAKTDVQFTGPVMIPMLKGPTPGRAQPFWMSLTPMEVFSLREGIRQAKGKVLCAGLGMGWMTMRILEKLDVEHVTQIELSPYVINFSGNPLQEQFPGKLNLVCADAWNYLDTIDLNDFDSIIFDIWPQYGSAHLDRRFQQLKSLHPNVWGWGDV